MENKYYTPNPEDLCKGLELEILNLSLPSDEQQDTKWVKRIFGNSYLQMIEYTKDQLSNFCRVKCLDKEDIESLGWEYISDLCPGDGGGRWFDLFKKDYCTLTFGEILCIRANSEIHPYGLLDNKHPGECIFKGNIWNKSELIKLMKQLNIK